MRIHPVSCRTPYFSARLRRGLTLVETMMSIFIAAFVFGFAGFLLVISAKTSYNLNKQFQAQTTTSYTHQRIANTLRQAKRYVNVTGDATNLTTYTQIAFVLPAVNDGETTNSFKLNTSANADGTLKQQIEQYANGTASGTPDRIFQNISGADFVLTTPYRMDVRLRFNYPGYLRTNSTANASKDPQMQLPGEFVSTVIAKNHFIDKDSPSYDKLSGSPATLY